MKEIKELRVRSQPAEQHAVVSIHRHAEASEQEASYESEGAAIVTRLLFQECFMVCL